MKKSFAIAILALLAVSMAVGCKSAGGCWSRNGSRVPTQTYAQTAPIMPEQVIYASNNCNPCASVTQACEPVCSSACDPCGTSGAPSVSGYPTPGM